MTTHTIEIDGPLDRFIEDRVVSGEFRNASEVVSAGLQLLKSRADHQQAKIDRFRAFVQEGLDDLDAGRYEDVDDVSAWLDKRGRARGT